MKPDESSDCEMVPDTMLAADLIVEENGEQVLLTVQCDDREDDLNIMLSPERARALGDHLFKAGSRTLR